MKSEIADRLGAVLLAGVLLGGAVSGEGKNKSGEFSAGPLIRKDLLAVKEGAFIPPLRDIFNPKPAFETAGTASNGDALDNEDSFDSDEETPLDGTLELSGSSLLYIGYIQSVRKIIALVIVDGEARAVSEGEEILPGARVEEVSPSQIVISSPDSTKRSFPLQGEES